MKIVQDFGFEIAKNPRPSENVQRTGVCRLTAVSQMDTV